MPRASRSKPLNEPGSWRRISSALRRDETMSASATSWLPSTWSASECVLTSVRIGAPSVRSRERVEHPPRQLQVGERVDQRRFAVADHEARRSTRTTRRSAGSTRSSRRRPRSRRRDTPPVCRAGSRCAQANPSRAAGVPRRPPATGRRAAARRAPRRRARAASPARVRTSGSGRPWRAATTTRVRSAREAISSYASSGLERARAHERLAEGDHRGVRGGAERRRPPSFGGGSAFSPRRTAATISSPQRLIAFG